MDHVIVDPIADELLLRLEQGAQKELGCTAVSFYVRICGKTVKMVYQNAQEAELAKDGFRKHLVSDGTGCTARFLYWQADFRKYLPQSCALMFSNGKMRLKVIHGFLLFCADYESQVYYYCTPPKNQTIGAHAMVLPLYLWGLQNDMIMTHSACIGYHGKGILLAAEGGGGKSTLAVSSLMQGLDFVSDDYTMLTGTGELAGMPIYSNIGLTPDSYRMLKPPYPVHWINHFNRDKHFMDISGEKNFTDHLEIRALIAPQITKGETKIYETETMPLVFAFFHSCIKQVLGYGNKEYMNRFFDRLKMLRTYRIELGPDVHYNAEFLRNFTDKEI